MIQSFTNVAAVQGWERWIVDTSSCQDFLMHLREKEEPVRLGNRKDIVVVWYWAGYRWRLLGWRVGDLKLHFISFNSLKKFLFLFNNLCTQCGLELMISRLRVVCSSTWASQTSLKLHLDMVHLKYVGFQSFVFFFNLYNI